MPSLLDEIRGLGLRALPYMLMVAAMMVILPLLLADRGWGSTVMFSSFLAYYLHRSALFGPPFRPAPDATPLPRDTIIRFMVLYLAFFLVAAIPGYFAGSAATRLDKAPDPTFIRVVLLVSLPVLWLLLVLFGTLLPAAAARRPVSPMQALRAARKTGSSVAVQLLCLPFAWSIASAFALSRLSDWAASGGLNRPVAVGLFILMTTVGLLALVMTAVILTRAYRSAWPESEAQTFA